MKRAKSLSELAFELDRRVGDKQDLVADTRELRFQADEQGQKLEVSTNGAFNLSPIAEHQVTDRVGIPRKYAQRMATEAPNLLAMNVNTWFTQNPERRMLRTYQSNKQCRAFLSDRYRRIDNEDIFRSVYPALSQAKDQHGLEIKSCEVTEKRMYIQAVFPGVEGEMRRGDAVQAGFILSNSEIGMGAFQVTPVVFRLVCLNGMIVPKELDNYMGLRKMHLGARVDASEDMSIYKDDTLKADDQALLLKTRDALDAMTDGERFQAVLRELRERSEEGPKVRSPMKAIEVLAKNFGLNGSETEGTLTSLLQDRPADGIDRWVMANALTAQAHSLEDYDRSVEFEEMGGRILTLPSDQWRQIAEAA